jgi:hypothetical protein
MHHFSRVSPLQIFERARGSSSRHQVEPGNEDFEALPPVCSQLIQTPSDAKIQPDVWLWNFLDRI